MENNKETAYKGFVLNGFMALILEIVLIFAAFLAMDNDIPALGIPAILLFFICTNGFVKLEPNEAMVLLFFAASTGSIRC